MIKKYHCLIHKYKKLNSKFEKAQEYIEKKYNKILNFCNNSFIKNIH